MLQLHLCKPHFEHFLIRECADFNLTLKRRGEGWIIVEGETIPDAMVFAHFSVLNLHIFPCTSLNACAEQLIQFFWEENRQIKIIEAWPCLTEYADVTGLAGRKKSLDDVLKKKMAGKMSRISKLAVSTLPPHEQLQNGLFLFIPDFDTIFAGTHFFFWGQHRAKFITGAPSRSFLKIEEAISLSPIAPRQGDFVTDLGAAPGGWSLSAAQRGAIVNAIDNGPLKGDAKTHPNILHRREDAFRFIPEQKQQWLFCDMIENPYRIVSEILQPWLIQGFTDHFIVNLKTGKCDPIELIHKLQDPNSRFNLTNLCARLTLRQLFHDREEITCIGSANRI